VAYSIENCEDEVKKQLRSLQICRHLLPADNGRRNIMLIRLQATALAFVLCTGALAQSLQLLITTPSDTVVSGKPVSISVQLMNGMDHEITVRQHVGEIIPGSVYKVVVTRADGRSVQETPFATSIRGGVAGPGVFGRSLREKVLLRI
jgi:hypothetical protein